MHIEGKHKFREGRYSVYETVTQTSGSDVPAVSQGLSTDGEVLDFASFL